MITVANEAEFRDAISNRETEILVANNIDLTSTATINYTLTIRGNPRTSLRWPTQAPLPTNNRMFLISETGELTLDSITLDGNGLDVMLVQIESGTFIMNQGTILQNTNSTTSKYAVKIGDLVDPVGGTLIMNGGLITNINTGDGAVFCSGGNVFMRGDAEISGNINTGISLTDTIVGGVRSTLTMTDQSRITGNRCTLDGGYGGGGVVLGSDVIMGEKEGDAPKITGNSSIGSCGGLFLTSGVNSQNTSGLIMRYNSEISDNSADILAGGVGAVSTAITMSENSAIKNNRCGGDVGGLMLSLNCTAVMSDTSHISGNVTDGKGGGIYIREASSLQMRGNSSIRENEGADGAGIYLVEGATADIGSYNSSPSIRDNRASGLGGGVYISEGGILNLSGMADISGNTALHGNGVYKAGELNISGSPRIADGLYIAESGDLPIIVGTLTAGAMIQLESSEYLSRGKVSISIAKRGPDGTGLLESDRAAWRVPPEFSPDYTVILNSGTDQVLITYQTYNIEYLDLFDAENPNPSSYSVTDLPIVLQAPGSRSGYTFTGWQDAQGRPVTEIPEGTAGNLSFTALWEKLLLSFDGNLSRVCNLPEAIPVEQGGYVVLPYTIPCKTDFCFLGWNTDPSGSGVSYYPGDTIQIADQGMTLYAQWIPVICCCPHREGRR